MNKSLLYLVVGILILGGVYYLTSGKPVTQSHRSYELSLTSKPTNVTPGQPATISYSIKNDKGEILKNYEVVHEKIMHFIVVRKDLHYFQHIHPTFNQSTGQFTIDVTFPTDGIYRVFPDFTPGKSQDNPLLLPVTLFQDVEIGSLGKYTAQTVAPDTTTKKSVGAYDITHIFPKQEELKAQKNVTFSLVVNKNGQPVTDLENYLGALGHSVILAAGNLDFIHTHPKADSGDHGEHMMQETGPQIDFATSFPVPGTYKIFTQFQHQGKVITVDYAILVN